MKVTDCSGRKLLHSRIHLCFFFFFASLQPFIPPLLPPPPPHPHPALSDSLMQSKPTLFLKTHKGL